LIIFKFAFQLLSVVKSRLIQLYSWRWLDFYSYRLQTSCLLIVFLY